MKMKLLILLVTWVTITSSDSKMKKILPNSERKSANNTVSSEKRLDFGDLYNGYKDFSSLQNSIQNGNGSNTTNVTESDEIEPKEYKANCFFKMKKRYYDFTPLSSSCGSNRLRNIKADKTNFYDFSFCSDIMTPCNRSGLFVNKATCTIFADSHIHEKNYEMIKNNTIMRVSLPQGEVCNSTTMEKYQIIFEIQCNPQVNNITILNQEDFNPHNCTNTIKMQSKYSCPSKTEYKPWYNQLGVAKEIIGYFLMGFGLVFLIFGEKVFDFFAGLFIGLIGGLFIYTTFSGVVALDFVVVMVVSIVVSFFLVSCLHSCLVLLVGVIVGYIGGNMIYNLEMVFIPGDPATIYGITILVCAFLGYFLAKYIDTLIIIVATSLLGAYFFVRGLSLLLGGYVEESYVYHLIKHKEIRQVDRLFGNNIYAYFFSMGLIAILGFFIQMGIRSDDDKNKEQPKEQEHNL